MKQKKFLFACGGTGGHVFPAVAIAESLKKMGVEQISFAGRKDSMESRLVSPHFEFDEITAVPLHRGSFMQNLSLPYNLFKAVQSARVVLKKRKPDVVVATGGYVSLPIVMAAGRAKIPVYIQEQNAVAGVANKVGARFAKKIFVTSEEARKFFPNTETLVFGNPVRELPVFESLSRPKEFLEGTRCVLVVGGSQGARGINEKMEGSLSEIAKRKDVSVVWQAGAKNVEEIRAKAEIPENVTLTAFLSDIYSYMGYADLIVSRAGASTLAEILAFGKPSILFPFPFATANHQEFNARVVEKAGAALVELDSEPNGLWHKVETLLADGGALSRMASAAKTLGMPDAADKIAKVILDAEC
jgi:UDP-N-acetylglucosamine--N-acetylmuramyl-(pentapeptide) pyrophosphoryl-undecaprenol N-acetylglucosamine transferase